MSTEIELQYETEPNDANQEEVAGGTEIVLANDHADEKQLAAVDQDKPQTLTADNQSVDKKLLWNILKETQCPLVPDKYDKSGQLSEAYYFNNTFWRQDGASDSCVEIDFLEKGKEELVRRLKDGAELMLAVNKYVSCVSVNKSYTIYHKLQTALAESQGHDDGNDENDAYQKLIPTLMGRVMFLSIFLTTVLNGYFIANSIVIATNEQYNTKVMNILALIMAICEAVLYSNILLGSILTQFIRLIYNLSSHQTTYVQSKVIASQLRELSTLSILRYMPSIEIVSNACVHWRETFSKIWADLNILWTSFREKTGRRNCFEVVFAVPVYFIELFAPILAVYAILVKIKQLEFAVSGEPFADWELSQYLSFVAFLNQVAGLRVLRNIETASIQHFVFSGADASLDTDELLLLDDWWNICVLAAVSNLHLGWYDNMVFWYNLDPQKIQLLLKDHSGVHGSSTLRQMVEHDDSILIEYDQVVMRRLDGDVQTN